MHVRKFCLIGRKAQSTCLTAFVTSNYESFAFPSTIIKFLVEINGCITRDAFRFSKLFSLEIDKKETWRRWSKMRNSSMNFRLVLLFWYSFRKLMKYITEIVRIIYKLYEIIRLTFLVFCIFLFFSFLWSCFKVVVMNEWREK